MTYHLKTSKTLTKVKFFVLVWCFAFIFNILGVFFITLGFSFRFSMNVEVFIKLFISLFLFLGIASFIGGAIAIGVILITNTMHKLGLISGGRKVNYFLLKALKGKLGYLLSFSSETNLRGEWYVEEVFSNEINLSRVKAIIKEVFIERWYDTLIFPTLLFAIIATVRLEDIKVIIEGIKLEDSFILLGLIEFFNLLPEIYLIPLFAVLALIILTVYYPFVWSLIEGGFKVMKIGEEGDIKSVKTIGSAVKSIPSTIIGVGAIITVGWKAVEIFNIIISLFSEQSENLLPSNFWLIKFLMASAWTIGLFLVLLSIIMPGVCLVALFTLEKYHLSTIKYLRDRSAREELVRNIGSITQIFSHQPGIINYFKDQEKIDL